MVFHMKKTTLTIDDNLMVRLKMEAARQKRTMSEMVEKALRRYLDTPAPIAQIPPLPTFDGQLLVDVSDREALYEVLDDFSLYK